MSTKKNPKSKNKLKHKENFKNSNEYKFNFFRYIPSNIENNKFKFKSKSKSKSKSKFRYKKNVRTNKK